MSKINLKNLSYGQILKNYEDINTSEFNDSIFHTSQNNKYLSNNFVPKIVDLNTTYNGASGTSAMFINMNTENLSAMYGGSEMSETSSAEVNMNTEDLSTTSEDEDMSMSENQIRNKINEIIQANEVISETSVQSGGYDFFVPKIVSNNSENSDSGLFTDMIDGASILINKLFN